MITLIISTGLGYLFGNIQTAYFLGKWTRKIDIRGYGTANAGASNAVSALLFYKHLPNLHHLYKGEEKGFWGVLLKKKGNGMVE